jgi:ubiquinone/menaquinone biosynthesis C-methylase UbiE
MSGEPTLSDRFWTSFFRAYDVVLRMQPYRDVMDELGRALDLPAKSRVLDAGAGTGNASVLLAPREWTIVSVDSNRSGLRMLTGKVPDSLPVAGTLQQPLPFPDESFDGVLSCNVLYSVPAADRPRALRELRRVLRPGGRIALHNPIVGFDSAAIYREHLAHHRRAKRVGYVVAEFLRCAYPLVRIYWMNLKLAKLSTADFFAPGEQARLLEQAGFSQVSAERTMYAGQGHLCSATKPG